MKNNYTLTFLILATIIGAGFASGKEIYVFFTRFGVISFLNIIICFILFYLSIKLYLNVGSSYKPKNVLEANKLILGKNFKIFNIFYVACLFIVLAGMFAGVYEVYANVISGVSAKICVLITVVLCVFETNGGLNRINKINNIFMPLTIILLLISAICVIFSVDNFNINTNINLKIVLSSVFSVISYVGINLLLSGGILMLAGKQYNKKTNNFSSLVSAVVLAIIIVVFNLAMLLFGNISQMPMLDYAFKVNYYLGICVLLGIWFCIYSAITSLAYVLSDMLKSIINSNIICNLIVVTISYVISLFGFGEIVTYLYPVIGVVGILFSLLLIKNNRYANIKKTKE